MNIDPIYSTFTIQTPSSSQLEDDDFIPSAQLEEEVFLAPTQSQIFNKPLLLSLTTNNVRRGAPTKASQKRKAAVDIATQESPVKKIKKLKAITDSQSAEFINYVIPSEIIDLGRKTDEESIDLLQLWSPKIMFLYVFLRDNEWDFDSYFTFEAKQALRSCFKIQRDKLSCIICSKNCNFDANSTSCSKCFVLFHNKCVNLPRSRITRKCVNYKFLYYFPSFLIKILI